MISGSNKFLAPPLLALGFEKPDPCELARDDFKNYFPQLASKDDVLSIADSLQFSFEQRTISLESKLEMMNLCVISLAILCAVLFLSIALLLIEQRLARVLRPVGISFREEHTDPEVL